MGVDFAGITYYKKQKNSTAKTYIVIYLCVHSRGASQTQRRSHGFSTFGEDPGTGRSFMYSDWSMTILYYAIFD
jgi:hypothetical protein